jgi:hypothetical protein
MIRTESISHEFMNIDGSYLVKNVTTLREGLDAKYTGVSILHLLTVRL